METATGSDQGSISNFIEQGDDHAQTIFKRDQPLDAG